MYTILLMFEVLREYSPDLQIFSIDESFLTITGMELIYRYSQHT
jgi:hypothetical protein